MPPKIDLLIFCAALGLCPDYHVKETVLYEKKPGEAAAPPRDWWPPRLPAWPPWLPTAPLAARGPIGCPRRGLQMAVVVCPGRLSL